MTWLIVVAVGCLVGPAAVLVFAALVSGSRADDALGYDDEVTG